MRIVFVGTVEFSRCCLNRILKRGGEVVAIFTLPPEKKTMHSDFADLSFESAAYGIPVFKVNDLNTPETVVQIRSLKPDVIFVFGWSRLISRQILKIPPLGCIGTHPALLPKHRGRHPLIWALVEGLEESGLTFFYLDEGADSGDILWQRPFPITLQDNAQTLYRKITFLAEMAIDEFLPQLERNTAPRIPQDHSKATYWRKRTEKDGEIQWKASSLTSYNLIRALSRPYVGAHTILQGEKVIIWKAELPSTPMLPYALASIPGTVLGKGPEGIEVRTGDGYLGISEYDCLNGGKINIGDFLGNSR